MISDINKILAALICINLSACGGDEIKKDPSFDQYEGEWTTGCVEAELSECDLSPYSGCNSEPLGIIASVSIDGDQYASERSFYRSSQCNFELIPYSDSGSIVFRGEVEIDGYDVAEIDLHIDHINGASLPQTEILYSTVSIQMGYLYTATRGSIEDGSTEENRDRELDYSLAFFRE